jgi:hypothetical protein
MAQCQWSMHMLVSVQFVLNISMQFSDYTRSPHSHVRIKQYTQFEQHCSILTPGPIEDGAFLKLRRTDDSIFYIKLHDSTLSAGQGV